MEPWEHPDWYDLHDDAWTAGVEREAEHYAELVLALPPLDRDDHLVDAGCGTGKATGRIAAAYPALGRVTLLEPSHAKLNRAAKRTSDALPDAVVQGVAVSIGQSDAGHPTEAAVVVAASLLMPIMESRGGTLTHGIEWLDRALRELRAMLRPGGLLFALDTLQPPWAGGGLEEPVRRLAMGEYTCALADAGFVDVECVYRFRDRVVVQARREG